MAKHCAACHGVTKLHGGVEARHCGGLDGVKEGLATEPGQAEESTFILSVIGEEGSQRMSLKRSPLSEADVEILRA